MTRWKRYLTAARPLVGTLPLLLLLGTATWAAELGLAAYQHGIFGAKMTQFHVVDRPGELALFFATAIAAHALLLALAWRLFRLLARRRDRRLLLFDFLFLFGTAFTLSLVARTKLTAILGGALTLPLVRGLGGGDLSGAFIYALVEGGFVLWIGGAAALLYSAMRLVLRLGSGSPEPERGARSFGRAWAAALLVPSLLFAAAGRYDVRLALDRFAAPWLAFAALEAATDVDRDSYSLFSLYRDRQPFDPGSHPLALDVPGNGVDEDGLAGDYRHSAGGEFLPAPRFGGNRRHVVLIALESTRAEALGKRWNGRPVAPNLRALAARGAHSEEAYSHVGFTMPSLRTLLTGRMGPTRPFPSLFSDFRRAGYRVAILSSESEDFGGIAKATGMRENADLLIDAKALKKESINPYSTDVSLLLDGRVLLRELDRNLGRRSDWRRPTFLYMNVQASHYPYDFPGAPRFLPGPPIPPGKIRFANREWVRRSYWNSVAYGDWLVGRIVARLERLGVLEDGILLVVADHGEELFEQDYAGHGQRLNDIQTRIPFVLNRRDIPLPRPVGLAHVRGLLLRAAGAGVPAPEPGRPIFQHTPDLDRPTEIAMVEPRRRRTILHLPSLEVRFEEADVVRRRGDYRDLPPRSALRAKADRLIRLWERERWIRHLERSGRIRP